MISELSFKSIINDPKQSTLYILTIAFLVMVIVAPTAIANGYSNQLTRLIPPVTGRYILAINSTATSLSDSIIDYSLINNLLEERIDTIIPQLLFYYKINNGSRIENVRIRGIDPGSFYEGRNIQIIEGNKTSIEFKANIGMLLSRRLNITLGDQIELKKSNMTVKLRIAGIVNCRGVCDDELLITIEDAWKIKPEMYGKINFIELKITEKSNITEVVNRLNEWIGDLKFLQERPFSSAATKLISQTFQSIKNWTLPIYFLIIMATYLVTMKIAADSDKDVALLRSLGASKRKALSFLLSKSLLISTFGVMLGIAFGVTCSQAIFRLISLLLSTGLYNPPNLTIYDTVQILFLAQLSSVLGCIYPAINSARKGIEKSQLWQSIHQ